MTTAQEFLSIPPHFCCIATLLKNDYVRRFKDLELYCSQVLKVAQRRRRGRKLVVCSSGRKDQNCVLHTDDESELVAEADTSNM